MKRFPFPPLAFVFAVLSAALSYLHFSASHDVLSVSAGQTSSVVLNPPNKAQILGNSPSLDEYAKLVAQVSARPLFSPTRRTPEATVSQAVVPTEMVPQTPEAPIQPAPEAAPSPPPDIQIKGIIRIDATASALIRNRQDQSETWVKVGEQILGWTLVEITQESIILHQGADEITMQIFQ